MKVTDTGRKTRLGILIALALGTLALGSGAAARTSDACLSGVYKFLASSPTPIYTCPTDTDWSVDPAYDGPVYADNTAAAADDPPPTSPPPVGLPKWRNFYDWPNGHGYAGWHSTASPFSGAYGIQSNLGGQYGLWLYPLGNQWYDQTEYAEWTYTAPGTTRLSSVQLSFSYRNKLLAHHCIDIGFRTLTGTITALNTYCKPAQPPDSQRGVDVSLADPASNPSSKVLFFRIRLACNGSQTSCSKYTPTLDPLTNGPMARLLKADMTLVDDDNPVLQKSDSVDGFNDLYKVSVTATDAGSGVKSLKIERVGGAVFASADAPCDPSHHTDALDNRICPQSFTLNGTLDISDLEDGTYTFRATGVDVAGNVGTLTWTVVIDRVSLDVTLNPLTATARDKYTTATKNDLGWTAKETIPSASIRQSFKWRVTLGTGQSLLLLPSGAVAVVDVPADSAGVDDPSPSPDDPADPIDGDPADTPVPDDGLDIGDADPSGNADADPDASEQAAIDRMTNLLGVLNDAQDATEAHVAAVIAAPTARDAAGTAIPVSYRISGNVVTVTIAHRGATSSYPVSASADLVEDAAADPDPGSITLAFRPLRSLAVSSCQRRAAVISYDPHAWKELFDAFKAGETPCADYYITVAAHARGPLSPVEGRKFGEVDYDGKPARTWPRAYIGPDPTNPQGAPVAQTIRDGTDSTANFHPVAEFAWAQWVKTMPDYCSGHTGVTRRACAGLFMQAGMEFRRRMACAGYDTTNGATWAINEFPSGLRSGTIDRANAKALLQGLKAGPPKAGRCTRTGSIPVGGAVKRNVYGIGMLSAWGQGTGLSIYKTRLESLLKDPYFWPVARSTMRYFGQETYADCRYTCLGSTLGQRVFHLNSFLQHPALLAEAAYGAGTAERNATTSARAALRSTYFSLGTAYHAVPLVGANEVFYGHTNLLSVAEMKALISMQVLASHRFQVARSPYQWRIGFAWNGTATAKVELAGYLALAVQNAFAPGISGTEDVNACTFETGTNVCLYTKTPVDQKDVNINHAWDTFRRWP